MEVYVSHIGMLSGIWLFLIILNIYDEKMFEGLWNFAREVTFIMFDKYSSLTLQ